MFNIQAINKVYPTGSVNVRALERIDLGLGPGETVVLLGASGNGKSTLFNLMDGLDTPTSNSTVCRDHNLSHTRDRDLMHFRREHIGSVFQSYDLIPNLTVRENVILVADIAEYPLDPTEALNRIRVETLADNSSPQMPGGEQQCVATARVVAKRPDVLLYDKPTGALDFQTRQLVLEVFKQVDCEFGTLIMIVTCSAIIVDIVDRIVRIGSGTIIEHRRNE